MTSRSVHTCLCKSMYLFPFYLHIRVLIYLLYCTLMEMGGWLGSVSKCHARQACISTFSKATCVLHGSAMSRSNRPACAYQINTLLVIMNRVSELMSRNSVPVDLMGHLGRLHQALVLVMVLAKTLANTGHLAFTYTISWVVENTMLKVLVSVCTYMYKPYQSTYMFSLIALNTNIKHKGKSSLKN